MKLQNFIDNQFVDTPAYIDSYNPATGKAYCMVPDSNKEDVSQAVKAARQAFPAWSKSTRKFRSDLMLQIANALESRLEEFAVAESMDQGKPVSVARTVDIPRAIYNFRYFAGKILYTQDHKTELDGVALNYVQRMPVGVAGLISPWNLPLYLLTWKIAPCIAAGNTCVCKPSEFTSVTAYMLCQIIAQILPKGVVNMVFGLGHKVGQALVVHPQVPLISFTGGTATGEVIAREAAPYHKKLSLELGGKNANIIFEDADMSKCLPTTVRSSFANQGEICLCGSRIFVHESVYEEFVSQFVKLIKETVVVSDPKLEVPKEKLHMGPLCSKQHFDKVQSYIKIALQEGGELVLHGKATQQDGYFLAPTVIKTSTNNKQLLDPYSSQVMQEEIFGPVVTVTPFKNEAEAIELANCTRYGLAATVWTENGKRQRRVAEQLRAGTVWVNCWMVRDLNMPFGGIGSSGIGREGADYSLDFYTEAKTICLSN